MQLGGRWRTGFGLAVAMIVASATVDAQKPVCTVSELGRSQEKSVPEHTHLNYFEDVGAGHDEAAWGRRLGGVLEFLLTAASTDQAR